MQNNSDYCKLSLKTVWKKETFEDKYKFLLVYALPDIF